MASKMMNSGSHMRLYKKASQDVDHMRAMRQEKCIELRKDKRSQMFLKTRDVQISDEEPDDEACEMPDTQPITPSHLLLDGLSRLQSANDTEMRLILTKNIRFLLRHKPGCSAEDIVRSGTIPYFVEFLKNDDCCELQYNAACILGFVATGNMANNDAVVTCNAIPHLTRLLASPNGEIQEIALNALGRIARVSAHSKMCVMKENIFKPMLDILNNNTNISIIRNVSFCASALCHGEIFDHSMLPVLSLLLHQVDTAVLTNTCFALYHVIKGNPSLIKNVIDLNACSTAVHLLMHNHSEVVYAALSLIGMVLCRCPAYVQDILDSAFLPRAVHLLSNKNLSEETRKLVFWAISDITRGTVLQLQQVHDANIFPLLREALSSGTLETRRIVLCAYKNAVCDRAPEVVDAVAGTDCIEALCCMLSVPDADIVDTALDILYSILMAGEKTAKSCGASNVYAEAVEKYSGLRHIEKLQDHENEKIYQKADFLVQTFFSGSCDLDNEMGGSAEKKDLNANPACFTEGFQF